MDKNFEQSVKVRLTKSQKMILEKNAKTSGINVSEYVRKLVFGRTSKTRTVTQRQLI